jgi:hypothetical protein
MNLHRYSYSTLHALLNKVLHEAVSLQKPNDYQP